jgi:uncharacterized protein (TIGR00288 family)
MFFDIENIVGGYGEGDEGFAKRVAGVSLTSIQGQIAEASSEPIGQFAVKRAYADWSQRDLRTLRKTLVEQGIEPRQVFGFGQGGKTNAADVELVIDVLELLHSRDEVSTYVIVSGDGGFGSLVRKLHEFGKKVIVAGHADRASGALRAVCDEFVVLDPPESMTAPAQNAMARRVASSPGPIDLLRAVAGPTPPIPARDHDGLLEAGTAFIAAVTADAACRQQLDKDGFLLANVGDVLKAFAAPDAIRSTFRGLRPFLSQILEGSNWIVTAGGVGEPARIVRRETASAIDAPASDPNALTLSDGERASIVEAAKGDPLDLPGALASVLISMHLRAGEGSLEIGQVMRDARGTGLREAAQGFFGTTTRLFRVALAGTDLCVMQSIEDPTRNWIRSRIEFDAAAEDAESMRILDDLPMPPRAQMARAVLVRTGLRLPTDPDDIDDVLRALTRMPLNEDETLNELISRLVGSETLPAAVELGVLRQMLAALIEVGVLVGPSRSSADWLDQPARQAVRSRVEMLDQLRDPIVAALRPYGLDQAEVLAGLLPLGSSASLEGVGAGRPA